MHPETDGISQIRFERHAGRQPRLDLISGNCRCSRLVRDLVRLFLPGAEDSQRLFAHHLQHGNLALRERLSELVIDEGVVKPDFGRIGSEITEMNLPEVGPIDRAQTHRAGFTGGVDLAIPQRKRLQSGASFADGDNFGVRGGIVRDRDSIDALRNDVAVFDDDGAERATLTGKNVIERELNGASHERVVHAFSLVACAARDSGNRESAQMGRHGLVRRRFAEKGV